MLLLMLFALIAGAGTAITPCVLPVLPALLSASAAGGRRRPLGIVLGLAVTFTIAIVALAQLVKGVGLATGATRTLAIVVLIVFGVVLLIPELSARVQAPLSRLARFGPAHARRRVLVGARRRRRARVRLRAVRRPDPRRRHLGQRLERRVGPGRRGRDLLRARAERRAAALRVRRPRGDRRRAPPVRGHVVERALGVVLLLTGVLMASTSTSASRRRSPRTAACRRSSPIRRASLENSNAVQNRLASLRPASPFAVRQREASATPVPTTIGVSIPGVKTPSLPNLGRRARVHRQPGLVQHPWRPAADARRPARPRRARRLLDLHVHQLHPHAAVRQGPVRDLPPLRARRRRRRDAGVHVRAGGVQRPAGDPHRRHQLSGRPGQPLRDLERVPEPVLAGRVLHRRPRRRPPHAVRRGRTTRRTRRRCASCCTRPAPATCRRR